MMTIGPLSDRLPTVLVTGFLGSGKTTLINSVLMNPEFSDALVVVNEFGEVGLDHLLVERGEDQVVLLDSGCLCCAVTGSLRDTLIELFMRRAQGSLPAFNRVIVETSGLANPIPLIATLVGDSAVMQHYRLSLVLTVVDALHGEASLSRFEEASRQVAVADRVLISKANLMTNKSDTGSLRSRLAATNEAAHIAEWPLGQNPISYFSDIPSMVNSESHRASAPMRTAHGAHVHHEGGHHGAHFGDTTSQVFYISKSVDWAAYSAWSASLSRIAGRRLLRCKGILRIESDDSLWVIQAVQGFFTPPARLHHFGKDCSSLDLPASFLVCIGDRKTCDEFKTSISLLTS